MDEAGPAALTVRLAADADLPVLDRAIPTGRNDMHAAALRRQAAGAGSYLVAWRGEEPVGTGIVRWTGRDGAADPEISNLYVPAALQSQGIGTAIIHFAEDLIRARRQGRVAIGVDVGNVRAAALYQRLGYVDTGARWAASYSWFDAEGREHHETEHVRVLVRDLTTGA
jgi:ribosomal protein S18 acetylase RimI-like enzyme